MDLTALMIVRYKTCSEVCLRAPLLPLDAAELGNTESSPFSTECLHEESCRYDFRVSKRITSSTFERKITIASIIQVAIVA
jgi:hypothetical protein